MKHLILFVIMLTFARISLSQPYYWVPPVKKTYSNEDMYSIRLNAVYTDDLVLYNYERLIPLGDKTALGLKGGVMIQNPIMLLTEAGFVYGGPQHFVETGAGTIFSINSNLQDPFFDQSILNDLDEGAYFTLRAGYRYQAPQGFLLKVSALYSPGNFVLPLIGLGYTF